MQIVTAQNDPNVKMPRAVREAAARADAMYKKPELEVVEPAPAPAPEDPPPVEVSPETPEAPQPVTSESNQPEPTPAPAPSVDWEHRFKSMQGRYERSQQEMRQMGEQVTNLQNLLAQMQAQSREQPKPATTVERLITPEEESEYGSDLLNVVGRRSRQEFLPELNELKQTLGQIQGNLQNVVQTSVASARDRMLNTLDDKIESWREINEDERFISWLRLPDPFSGVIRHELLKEAYGRNETARVLNFFQGFLAQEAAGVPQARDTGSTGATATTQVAPQPRISLESLAAPGRAKTAAASNAPAEKPLISRAQIAEFYAHVAANKYRGREQEQRALELQIFEAQRDGRIR